MLFRLQVIIKVTKSIQLSLMIGDDPPFNGNNLLSPYPLYSFFDVNFFLILEWIFSLEVISPLKGLKL